MQTAIVGSADTRLIPTLVVVYDMNDFSKGGELRCPVAECNCFHALDFDFKTAP
jgi:hypothetical protein